MNKYKITLAGNPNVGKSTIFNALTGLNQHTGNWPGKTVGNAIGEYEYHNKEYIIYDLPGTYSLNSNSQEEQIARDFILSNTTDVTVVVCDSTALERNLNLVFQIMEITPNVIVCLNLMDEAIKKKIKIKKEELSKKLKVPVIETSANKNLGLETLKQAIEESVRAPKKEYLNIEYPNIIENNIRNIKKYLDTLNLNINTKWLSLKLLDDDKSITQTIKQELNYNISEDKKLQDILEVNKKKLQTTSIKELVISTIIKKCEILNDQVTDYQNKNYHAKNIKIDKIITSKIVGIPLMILTLFIILWLTIIGSNYPSDLLYRILSSFEDNLYDILSFLPHNITNCLVYGVYRTVYWVVSVMLPPMVIFFALFTILEDLGYLPRISFNLDRCFHKCKSCGKQSLTMCMGFGCNAVGVTGCRIIDSKRERLISILTNVFMPCNGRFPMLIAIITMFLVGTKNSISSSFLIALYLILLIIIGVLITFIVSRILSQTLLKGEPSSFILELPPYRKPQILKVIYRSIIDRTIFVLGRAITISIPAGIIIYILANTNINGTNLLTIISDFLNPIATIIGLDGVILLSFILGFPANEIVIPIMMMTYMSQGIMTNYESLSSLKTLLLDNGWTTLTAICTIIFSLIHFPCSTTVITIHKETKRIKWTILSIVIPTICGVIICFLIATIYRIII